MKLVDRLDLGESLFFGALFILLIIDPLHIQFYELAVAGAMVLIALAVTIYRVLDRRFTKGLSEEDREFWEK